MSEYLELLCGLFGYGSCLSMTIIEGVMVAGVTLVAATFVGMFLLRQLDGRR